jgi:RHS repeat-associated protein
MTQRGSETLVYSARGELLERTAGGHTVAYAYDGYGRRVGRKNGSENWSQYLYLDPLNAYPVTATRDPDGVLTTYHYDDFGHLFAFQRGVDWFYVATDQVGTPRVVSDATGNIIKTLDYDSYGVLIADSNPGFDLPIGFAGGISDRVTGLVRFGARDYDPAIGRWTAKDPSLFAGGDSNLYGYVFNNPVSRVDREGRKSKDSTYIKKDDKMSPQDDYAKNWRDWGGHRYEFEAPPNYKGIMKDYKDYKARCDRKGEGFGSPASPAYNPFPITRDPLDPMMRYVGDWGGFRVRPTMHEFFVKE